MSEFHDPKPGVCLLVCGTIKGLKDWTVYYKHYCYVHCFSLWIIVLVHGGYVPMCVYACVCCLCDLGVSCSSSRTESILTDPKGKEDLKKRQRLSHESGTFLDLLFLCVFIPRYSLRWSACIFSWPGWFSVTISGWPTTRSKSCLRVPAPGASPVPFTSLCADSQAQVPKCLLASRPSSLNSSPLLKLVSSSYFYFPPILY